MRRIVKKNQIIREDMSINSNKRSIEDEDEEFHFVKNNTNSSAKVINSKENSLANKSKKKKTYNTEE